MPLRQPLDPNAHPLSKEVRQHLVFSAPVPGSSLTKEFGSQPFEKPPQFTKLPDAMHYLMDQMLEPIYNKQLLMLMDAGIAIESITRTLLFTGFTYGKWSCDLGLLLYKPLMLALLAIAHRAGLKDTPVLIPKAVANKQMNNLKMYMQANQLKTMRKQAMNPFPVEEAVAEPLPAPAPQGFMARSIS